MKFVDLNYVDYPAQPFTKWENTDLTDLTFLRGTL